MYIWSHKVAFPQSPVPGSFTTEHGLPLAEASLAGLESAPVRSRSASAAEQVV